MYKIQLVFGGVAAGKEGGAGPVDPSERNLSEIIRFWRSLLAN